MASDTAHQQLPSSDEDFWEAVAAQVAREGSSATPAWRQVGATERPSPSSGDTTGTSGRSGTTRGKAKGAAVAAAAAAAAAQETAGARCALCEDVSEGRWVTRCKGTGTGGGGTGTRQQLACPIWVHPACAWQNEGYAMRSIAGSSRLTEAEDGQKKRRLPTVFFACPQHDKPATYCSCKREEGEDEDGAEDYIECESCSEWYHFSCEGLDEDNPPDVYSCKRCRQLAAKGQKVPAQERRRNKAKTNEYLCEMLANKVMQIQQWVKEVKVLAATDTAAAAAAAATAPDTVAAAAAAAAQARYASLKELLSRREELEAPLEEEEEEDGGKGVAKSNNKKGKGGRGGGGGGGSSSGGSDAGDDEEEQSKVVHGMEGVYAEALGLLEAVAEESDTVEAAVDAWFDEHPEGYYKKSDGGARLGYWKTSAAPLEDETRRLEALVASARSARAGPPAAVAAAEDALGAARWALRAVGLFTAGAGSGGGGGRSPAFAEVSALLDDAEEGMATSADRRGRANTAWQHVNDIRSMATQWIRRAKTCLRADGAAAGVTLAVMRRHLSSGDAVPVDMPEYHELERVASEWEAWEGRALKCAASLDAIPLDDLVETAGTPAPGETQSDKEALALLQEAEAFSHGVKTSAKDALTRLLGRRSWAQRAAGVISCGAKGIARPSVSLTKSLMAEAGKLGLLRAGEAGVSPLVAKVRALADGEGPVMRARELLKADGGLSEASGDRELCEGEGVLSSLRATPVVYPEEEALALRLDALRWNEAASKGLSEVMTYQQLLSLHEQITGSEQLESMLEGFRSCMPMYTKVSKVKRWQERAQKLLKAARSKQAAPGERKENGEEGGEGLRRGIEAALTKLEDELKVPGVPEALELSSLLQEASIWEDDVRRATAGVGASCSSSSTSAEELLSLAERGERVVSPPQLVEALRWRAACLRVTAPAAGEEGAGTVAALLAAGDVLSAWSKDQDGANPTGGAAAGATPARELVAQTVAAGVRALGWHSWRVLAAGAAFVAPPATGTASPQTHKPTLSEGRALLSAVVLPGNSNGSGNGSGNGNGGGAKPVPVLEGEALATAAASAEFAALRAAVAAKDAAVAAGAGRCRTVFPAPPAMTWKEVEAALAAGSSREGQERLEWDAWRQSVSGLVEDLDRVLGGLVGAAPSLRSALESHLERRITAGRWLVVAGEVLFPPASRVAEKRLPRLDFVEDLIVTPPLSSSSAMSPYEPGDDALPSPAGDGADGAAAAAAIQQQSADVVARVLACLKGLHADGLSWLEEARAALAGVGGGGGGGAASMRTAAAAGGSAEAIAGLLARGILRAVQFPEEELLGEALKAQRQWNPKVLAALAVPLARTGGAGGDNGAWLTSARRLLEQAPPTLPSGSCYLSLLRWTVAVGETAEVMGAATSGGSLSFNESRPALTDMEPLAERGRALLLNGTGIATLLSAVGIAPPAGVMPPLSPASPTAGPLRLRLSDGPLSALSTIETVTRGVDACRQWVAGANALVSGGGLDGASSIRLVQELQANRQLPYAVDGGGGGGLRATLAHELSLKAPEHPELAHHLGSVGGFGAANGIGIDEDDGMTGVIDIGDAGWGSNSELLDGSSSAAMMAAIDVGTVAAAVAANPTAAASGQQQIRRNGSSSSSSSSGGGGGGVGGGGGNSRNGAASSARAVGLQTASVARAVPPPLFTNSAAPTTRGSRNQRTSPFNLKSCSSCKKDRIPAIKCRVDCGPDGQQPGSPQNAATAAAAASVRDAVLAYKAAAAGSGAGPRVPVVESASDLLERMLGSAAPPPLPVAPVARAPIPAPRVAPGAPVVGGLGLKRTRCLASGCTTPVDRNKAFCSNDCVVVAQKQVVHALMDYHKKQRKAAAAAGAKAGAGSSSSPGAAAANGGSSVGGEAVAAIGGAEPAAGGGGGGTAAAAPKWTAEDEQSFAKGLEAVRARGAQTAGQRFRHKVMDRFRELFAEGMAELGVESADATVLSGVLAWDLERELNAFSRTNRGVYKEKAQSLRFNIKFAKNPELFKDLLTGGTSMKTLCGMSTDELASSHLKEERKRIRDESYAGHMRQEDEGNEIVYKDGALQKIDKVKSDAKKQV
ncbi:unnamed protein product [Pylaiella littoralis]